MKWTLIINPNSGGGKAQKKWPKIKSVFEEQQLDYEPFFTTEKGHGIRLSKRLAEEGRRKFVVIGGDGILNEVINGLCVLEHIPLSEFVVGSIPIGSGSDWVKTHHIPTQIAKAVGLLKDPIYVEHDVGKATYQHDQIRYFINVAGLAFDAFVVQRTEKYTLKGLLGHLIYLFGLLTSLHKYPFYPFGFSVNDTTKNGPYFCLNVGICKYSGGGMMLVPEALPDDALFDITVIDKMSPLEVILNIRYLFNGKIHQHKKVQHFKSSHVSIHPIENDIPFEVDGEFIGNIPVEFRIIDEKLRVVVGKSQKF